MKHKKFTIESQIKSFKYAFNGIVLLFKGEMNARIHLIAAIGVIILAVIFEISFTEWALIVFAIGMVFVTETINTSIERIVDIISPEYNKKAGEAKDVAAGAVLLAAIFAVVIGAIVFLPKLLLFWRL